MLKPITALSAGLLTVITINTAQAGEFSYTVGAVTGLTPDYIGSDDYTVFALPLLGMDWEADETVQTLNGYDVSLGLHSASVSFPEGLEAGILRFATPSRTHMLSIGLGYDGGRDVGDNAALKGMGNIDEHLTGSIALGSEGHDPSKSDWYYEIDYTQALNGDHDGATLIGAVGYSWPLNESLTFATDIGMTWANDDFMQANFGVTGAQASTSANKKFSAESGLMGTEVTASLQWMITENWVAFGELSYGRLVGDAADSPLVDKEGDANVVGLTSGVVYAF